MNRHEYLYDLEYWELVLIDRGYNRRNILMYQLQRITAYSAAHCMSGDKESKGPDGWLPIYFDNYKDMSDRDEVLSDDEVDDILADIQALNEAQQK